VLSTLRRDRLRFDALSEVKRHDTESKSWRASRSTRDIRTGKVWGKGISQNVVRYVVKGCCERAGLEHIAPHDLRRTCAKPCHTAAANWSRFNYYWGMHRSRRRNATSAAKQNLGHPVNDLY
jgi:hypothetical protein